MEAGNRCKDECLPRRDQPSHSRYYLQMSTLHIQNTHVATLRSADFHASALMLQVRLWLKCFIRTSPRLRHPTFISASDWRRASTFSYLLIVKRILTPRRTSSLFFNAINAMAEKYDMPILYSCHPRSRNRLIASGFQLDPRVQVQQPLGFHDYNCLQMKAYAVVSDSVHFQRRVVSSPA